MKKQWLPLVFAVFLLLAPIAAAADGSAPGWLEDWIDQIITLLVGDEIGLLVAPHESAQPHPSLEIGELYPPSGPAAVTGDVPVDQPEIGASYPPHG